MIDAKSIQDQIKLLDKNIEKAALAKNALRDFVESTTFFNEYRIFDKLLSIWADTLLTLMESTGTSYAQSGMYNPKTGFVDRNSFGLSNIEQSDLTLTKAVVLAIGILGSVLLVVFANVSWVLAALTIFACLFFCFFRQILQGLQGLSKKENDAMVPLNSLSGTISQSLTYMRGKYQSTRFLIKHQHENSRRLASRRGIVDPALYNRKAQAEEDLPHEFMSIIDTISVSVNTTVFQCKVTLLSLRAQPRQSLPSNVPQQGNNPD
jgi:hypothetical protein